MTDASDDSVHNERRYATRQSLNDAIWNICKVLRRSNCASALQYIPELTWILFLRILDEQETHEAQNKVGPDGRFVPSIEKPYRWQDWAAPHGSKRKELLKEGDDALFNFVNLELFPYLKASREKSDATARQKVISEIVSSVERIRVDTEENFLEVLDKVHRITSASVDATHIFTLSQIYEGLLLKMGEKSSDGGQFFTPREIIRVMVDVISPQPGETIYDPCCGTGGFLAQSYEYMRGQVDSGRPTDRIESLESRSFFGREKDDLIYPIALANLILHGIDEPHVWHGNTLTGKEIYGGLFRDAPSEYDVVLTNPPFGGQEGKGAQKDFAYKASSTQILFLQHVIESLKEGGRCGIVLDEGVLFRSKQAAFVQTKRKLLDECDVWSIVSLPNGVFTGAGAGVKTDLLFFTKGSPTEKIWYYDLSDIKVGKISPFTRSRFDDFLRLLPLRADSERSWTVTRREIEAKNYDLKAVNPYIKGDSDKRTPGEILTLMEEKNRTVADTLTKLRKSFETVL
jgi:type I restriction enzyme M protein